MSTYFTRIAASGFKGRAFDLELASVTLLTGCNATGKTAVIQALELAATGKVAGVASTGAQIHERLASGKDLGVLCAMGSDKQFRRAWELIKKGKVEYSDFHGALPDDWTLPAILFDQSEFLGLSGKERTKYLFRVLPPPPLDKVGPVAVVTALKQMRFEPHTEAHTEAVNAMCRFIESDHTAAIQNPLGKLVEAMVKSQVIEKKFGADYIGGSDASALCTVQDWLVLMCEQIRLKCNAAVAAAKRMRETCLGVTQLKAPDAASLSQMQHEKQQAQAALEAAGAALATCREQYRAKDAQVKEAERVAASYIAPEAGARERLQDKIKELRVTLDVPLPAPAAVPRVSSEEQRKGMEEATTRLFEAWKAATAAQAEVDRLAKAIEDASASTHCPTCGSDITAKQKAIIADYKRDLKAAQKVLTTANGRHTSATAAQAVATGHYRDAEAARKQAEDEQHRRNETYQAESESRRAKEQLLRLTESQLATLDTAAAQAAPAKAAQESLPQLRSDLEKVATAGLQAKQVEEAARVAFTLAEGDYKKALADAASARTTAQAAEAADKAQAEADVLKELQRYLADLLAKCVELSVGPLVDTCNAMVTGILTAPVAVQEGEIGLLRGGKLAPWQACSDSEQMLMFAGLKLALAAKSEVRLAIVPRLESVDYKLKPVFVRRMLELVSAGKVDQVIMVEVAASADAAAWVIEDEAFKVIEVK